MRIEKITNWLSDKGLEYVFRGDRDYEVTGFASLNSCESNKLTWVKKKANYDSLAEKTKVAVAVVQQGVDVDIPNKIIATNSKEVFFSILQHFWGDNVKSGFRGPGTYISPDAKIDSTVSIGANCSIVGNIHVGPNTIIENNVVIQGSVAIGNDCIIHSGTVIGKDGFGFAFDENNIPVKVPHFGGVIIGDRVEIGANCTIDRGTIDDTIIGNDVKIDNLVLVAHNVIIEDGVLVVGCTDLAGSSRIGEKSYIGPQVCIKNQISVGKNSFIGMDVMLNDSVQDDTIVIKSGGYTPRKCKNYRRFL